MVAEAADVPMAFVAVTANAYAVPLVSPVMVHDPVGPAMTHVRPSGLDVTVWETAGQPLAALAIVTVACPSPGTAVGTAGWLGPSLPTS